MAVDIWCDGRRASGEHQPHDPYRVARWIRIDGVWARTSRVVDPGGKPQLLKGELAQLLHDDKLLESPDEWRSDARARYPLKCPRCRFDIVVNKSAELVEFLDTHDADEADPAFLADLAATFA